MRLVTLFVVLLSAAVVLPGGARAQQALPAVTVYKSPTCGCCSAWSAYLEARGFTVRNEDRDDMDAVKRHLGVPPRLGSCHTAVVDGYVIEGHVPAEDIVRLLRDRPQVAGLSAPGMPASSPGMGSEQPRGYDVLSFGTDGAVSVYASY
ncbi:MAG: DUF411 domain-containing protein [Ectothiorhodospiraceae bacterium]|nr:DUF411 domain-containing protein [Ectothiorhodospiraceae bacterium]